ncbi:hypothetical protein GCM10027275_13350 [Rhabdobacter roseus]|uniref:Glycosyltransferase involved in cell wall biosynthesis n=1 Tax=Rhabdobacter roseus TaxID=1655419 RepID=A0A840TIR8_9BACT|nr:glycosyltransferase [Rhabdobacter roseus]MBB5283251.1 glycosyltransferase involved in cell wall biosynthesis [Rhabdobacter roseus]
MKVLFVSSGNKKGGISPIVYNQGESIKKQGIELDYFTVEGKGWKGYVEHLIPLAKKVRQNKYDLVHAHYSLCGILATMAVPKAIPIIVSLMGTFQKNTWKYHVIRFLGRTRWKEVIVKSALMKKQIGIDRAHILPNGVDLTKFHSLQTKEELRAELGLPEKKKIVLFVSDPARPEKNFALCKASVEGLEREGVELVAVYNKPHEEVTRYMLAADVLMLTSFTEGSPNVIKEAMAASCPIVSTNVGDVSLLLNGLEGTYILHSFSSGEGTLAVRRALAFEKRTEGVNQLKMLHLDEVDVAQRIIHLYQTPI